MGSCVLHEIVFAIFTFISRLKVHNYYVSLIVQIWSMRDIFACRQWQWISINSVLRIRDWKRNTAIPFVIPDLNWNFIVQGTVSDLKTSLFGSPSEHQSAVPAIKGEQRRARTSLWEFREASTTQLSATIHIQDLIDLQRSLFEGGSTRKFYAKI